MRKTLILWLTVLSTFLTCAAGPSSHALGAHQPGHYPGQIPPWLILLTFIISAIAVFQLVLNLLSNSKNTLKSRELHAKEKEYNELVETANAIILRWDKDGIIRFINTYGINLFGYTREEMIGKNILGTIIPGMKTDDGNLPVMQNGITCDQTRFVLNEYENIGKDGRRLQIQWSNSPIYDEEGRFLEMNSIGMDITALKKQDADLFQSRKMEVIGNLAGGMAHDFNNILSIIWGYAELAHLNSFAYEDIEKYISQVLMATKRAKDFVGQLLTFSGRTESVKQRINPALIIREALPMIQSVIPPTITIEHIIETENDIYGDPGQIHQVMINLCTNAYQAMEMTGGVIVISLTDIDLSSCNEFSGHEDFSPGPFVCLTIRDTGVGIEKDMLGNIFEPYFTTKGKGKGTGLGLAVVHGIVKNHHGYINVESSPGEGTSFRIFFPANNHDIRITPSCVESGC